MNVDNSKDNIDCPICLQTLTSPVTLPCCKNRFCMKCMDGWRNDEEDCIRGNRTCPCCRALVPPTQHVLSTIEFYKNVSLSLGILKQDVPNLPLPPFLFRKHLNQVAIRHRYKKMEQFYKIPVRCFEQNYGPGGTTMVLPSPPPTPIHLPVSVVQAIRSSNFKGILQFLGDLPIPPQRLNAICPSENGNTMLHIAVQANNLDMVNALLALGANADATNSDNSTPLLYAVKITGSDDLVAKALIQWGAKKVSTIGPCPFSLNLAGTDHLLVSTAQRLGKSELARILASEDLGRYCKVLVNGTTRRGTIENEAFGNFYVLLDDSPGWKHRHVTIPANMEMCKPLLFDFRNIDRTALFPSQSPLARVPGDVLDDTETVGHSVVPTPPPPPPQPASVPVFVRPLRGGNLPQQDFEHLLRW